MHHLKKDGAGTYGTIKDELKQDEFLTQKELDHKHGIHHKNENEHFDNAQTLEEYKKKHHC